MDSKPENTKQKNSFVYLDIEIGGEYGIWLNLNLILILILIYDSLILKYSLYMMNLLIYIYIYIYFFLSNKLINFKCS